MADKKSNKELFNLQPRKMTEKEFNYFVGNNQISPCICPLRSIGNKEILCQDNCKLYIKEVFQDGTDEVGAPRLSFRSYCALTYNALKNNSKAEDVVKVCSNEEQTMIDW